MGLFLDLLNVPVDVTNDALEGIYKAMSDGHGHGDDGIWKPHDSPLVRRLIELFTERGLLRLDAVHQQFMAWKAGAYHKASANPPPPPGIMGLWDEGELALARLYLESLPPSAWTLDDHMLAIEYVVQRNLPPDAMLAEADWLAAKATMLGKVQANLEKQPTLKQADAILAAMPSASVQAAAVLAPKAAAVLTFARQRVAENVRALTEDVRHKMRSIVSAHLEQQIVGGAPAGTSSLQTKLLDAFGSLNRDWRRIAITEAGEAQLQGLIASLQPGTKVKRVEQYQNACAFCRKIDGVVAEVVPADAPGKNPVTQVWPGKNNIGRSASPKKRVGDVLIDRSPDEMWQLPAGLAHPHCRGRWVVVAEAAQPGDDPEFAKVLAGILGGS